MQNNELVKVLEWVKTHYPEAYEKWSPYGYDYELDLNNNLENEVDYPIRIDSIGIGINFSYRLPKFSKEFGFVGMDYYIDLKYEVTPNGKNYEKYICNIQTFEEFVTAFNEIPK